MTPADTTVTQVTPGNIGDTLVHVSEGKMTPVDATVTQVTPDNITDDTSDTK